MNEGLDFDDVLIVPTTTEIDSRKNVDLVRTFWFKDSDLPWSITPIVASNMHHIGTPYVCALLGEYEMPAVMVKGTNYDDVTLMKNCKPVFSFGMELQNDMNPIDKLFTIYPEPIICLDVANGYMNSFVNLVKQVKEKYPTLVVIAGNVATGQGAYQLFKAGADIVKVGIGPGLACSTRFKTGVGIPQITAIQEASTVAKSFEKRYVMADGGCKNPGDIAKAFVAGADMVMIGGMLAGHDETTPVLYGSSSWRAMEENGVDRKDVSYRTSEGLEVEVESKGLLKNTVEDILGGLRSTCSYTNSKNIQELKKAQFIKVNRVK